MSGSPLRRHLPGPSSGSRSTAIHHAARTTPPPANGAPEASSAETNGATCQQQGHISQGARQNLREELDFEQLPEDILHHIHSLLPLQDAARAACTSRGFLRSWRCYSNLSLNQRTLGLTKRKFEEREKYFIQKVDQILQNHHNNGVKVKILKLELAPWRNIKASCINRWLQISVKSGIRELHLYMGASIDGNYNFPCSVLSDEAAASSIESLRLSFCPFNPTSTLGLLRRLTSLLLSHVSITEEGLGLLLSKSSALERLEFFYCSKIICLQIPCTLQKLNFLNIVGTKKMRVEINAPNLCTFRRLCGGVTLIEISVRNSSQLKDVYLSFILLSHARARLPSIAGNVERLTMHSLAESVNIPMLPSKFRHLKNLEIEFVESIAAFSQCRYILSLVSFLDASPSLDSFILRVRNDSASHDVLGEDDDNYLRRLECRHERLRRVMITGFCPSKSLVELTIHILERAPSLERLTLDTTYGYDRASGANGKCLASSKIGRCWQMSNTTIAEAHRAVEIAGRCIATRVPSSVVFEVLEPCSRCHTGNDQ